MKKSVFIVFCFLQTWLWSEKPPNILFISIDDLRVELGCYGSDYIHSPNLDRLAETSVVFERAYCQQAVCTPSRASLFTGQRPDTNRVIHLRDDFRQINPAIETFPQLLQKKGYLTQSLGKMCAPYDPVSWTEPGWADPVEADPLQGGLCGAARKYADPVTIASVQAEYDAAVAAGLTGITFERAARGPVYEAPEVDDEAYFDGRLATAGIEAWQKLHATGKPFMLALGFTKPHLPFNAPKKYFDLYDESKLPSLENDYHPLKAPWYALGRSSEFRNYDGTPEGTVPHELAYQFRRAYYACISYVDAQIGRVLDAIEASNGLENTIIIVWSDHGFKLGEHDAWGKSTNVNLDIRVPFIIRMPGVDFKPARTSALVELVDIYPTLADYLGLEPAHELEGLSLLPLLKNPGRPWKRAAFSQYPRSLNLDELERRAWDVMGYTMVTERYRLTRWDSVSEPGHVAGIELYDLKKDPEENLNVAREPEYRETLSRLMLQLTEGWKGALPAGL